MPAPEIALLLELVLDLKKDIGVLKTDSDKNTSTLEEHMRRTEAAEKRLAILEKRDQMLNGFVKISAALLGFAGTALAVWEAVHHLL